MIKDDLLLDLCKRTAAIPVGGYDPCIYSVPHLSRYTGETKYRIRKLLKELEADGFVRKTYEGGIDEDGYPHCYHGWGITQKAQETEMYKKCYKDALEDYARFTREFDEEWEREEAERIGNR